MGETLNFTVNDSLWIDGVPVIPQGTAFTGTVAAVTPARQGARNGSVSVTLATVELPTGESTSFRNVVKPRTRSDKVKTGAGEAAAVVAVSAAYTPIVLVGFFAKGMRKPRKLENWRSFRQRSVAGQP